MQLPLTPVLPPPQAFLRALKRDDTGLIFREVAAEEMPVGYRFVHFGLLEIRAAHSTC